MPIKRPIKPTKPAAPYLGGKRLLAKTIVPLIDGLKHQTYAEPFVGMGGIFLRRTVPRRSEVVNDYNREVANFFRVLQRHYVAFLEMLKFQITSRTEFERLCATRSETLTDLELAGRFLYLQRSAFGGKVSGRSFGVTPGSSGRFDITKLGPILEELHTRLSGVVIECLCYDDFIKRYDRAATLFYIDPPYFHGENDYGKGMFSRADYAKLATLLGKIKGKFLLSINDVQPIRKAFSTFKMVEVSTKYTVSGKGSMDAKELLISNF